jgi:hypothetical protein
MKKNDIKKMYWNLDKVKAIPIVFFNLQVDVYYYLKALHKIGQLTLN